MAIHIPSNRLSAEEALHLLKEGEWLKIAQNAWEKRVEKTGDKRASYTLFPIINYTNVCSISCRFCSFKAEPEESKAYVLSEEEIDQKIAYAYKMGARQIFLQGGVHPDLKLDFYTEMLRQIKAKYDIHIRAFSPVELQHIALQNDMEIEPLIRVLKESGLDSVPGAGAEILVDRVRDQLAPNKCTAQEWARIMTICHQNGLYGSANIVFGSVETDEDIIEHLQLIRNIQDKTGGFNSFVPWTFQQQTKDFEVQPVMHHDYLKVLGICRLFLDNIDNIEVSVMVLGQDIGKLALRMGANDISSPVIEENVLRSYGVKSEEEARKLIRQAGFEPFRRDFNYQEVKT